MKTINWDIAFGTFLFCMGMFLWYSYLDKRDTEIWNLHDSCMAHAGTEHMNEYNQDNRRFELYRECMGGDR